MKILFVAFLLFPMLTASAATETDLSIGKRNDVVEQNGVLTFNGETSSIRVGVKSFPDDFTFAVWVSPDEFGKTIRPLIERPNSTNQLALSPANEPMFAVFMKNNKPTHVGVWQKINPGTWCHVAGSYQASTKTIVLYVNGQKGSRLVLKESIHDNERCYVIGRGFKGKMVFPHVFKQALSEEEIRQLYLDEKKSLPASVKALLGEYLPVHANSTISVLSAAESEGKVKESLAAFAQLIETPDFRILYDTKLPQYVRNRVQKRLELANDLSSELEKLMHKKDVESVMYAYRMAFNLDMYCEYFGDEIKYAKFELANPVAKIFNLRDFGAVGDGKTDDSEAFKKALEAIALENGKKSTLFIPRGSYLLIGQNNPHTTMNVYAPSESIAVFFDRKYKTHFIVNGLKNLTILGETPDTLILYSGHWTGMQLFGCENVTVENLTLRYRNMTNVQGTVESFDAENKKIVLRFDENDYLPESPEIKSINSASWSQGYSPDGRLYEPACNIVWDPKKFRALGGNRYEIPYSSDRLNRDVPVGTRLAFPLRQAWPGNLRIILSKFVTIKNVTVNNSYSSAIGSVMSSATSLVDTKVVPAPNRLISSAADGFFCDNNKMGPYLENCQIIRIADDGFNVLHFLMPVLDYKENELIFEPLNFLAGNHFCIPGEPERQNIDSYPIAVIDGGNGQIKMIGRIQKVSTDAGNGMRLVMDRNIPNNVVSKKMVLGKSVGETKLPFDLIVPLNYGVGTVITGCVFGYNRHNGLTLQANSILVENTKITDCSDFAVNFSIGADPYGWKEGPGADQVIFRNNTLSNSLVGINSFSISCLWQRPFVCQMRFGLVENCKIVNCKTPFDLDNITDFTFRNIEVTDSGKTFSISTPGNLNFINVNLNGHPLADSNLKINPSRVNGKIVCSSK